MKHLKYQVIEDKDSLLSWALGYAGRGWSVFPLKPKKKAPLTRHGWKDATTSEDTIREWWKQHPDANIGLACGPSGVVVLDFDEAKDGYEGGELLAKLQEEFPTLTSQTGGGWHFFYSQPNGEGVSNARGKLPKGVDVRGNGGYVVVPPSIHPNGSIYRWDKDLPIAPLPDFVLEILTPKRGLSHPRGGTPYGRRAMEQELARLACATEGERNETLNRVAFALGQLVSGGELDRNEVKRELEKVATSIGLSPVESRATIESGLSAGGREPRTAPRRETGAQPKGRKPARDVIFDLAMDSLELFTDATGVAYASFEKDGHQETWHLRSGAVRAFLGKLYKTHSGGLPGSQALQDATVALEGEASGNRREVFVRVAHVEGVTWIDLGDPSWKAIRVDSNGWKVVDRPGVDFRRPKGAHPLPVPEEGTLEDLTSLFHVADRDTPLVVAWLLAAISGIGPFPILAMTGEQGTAKSTTARLLKRLTDPATAELRGAPKDLRDLMIASHNCWTLCFDNVSYIGGELSDALCRIATGGGYATRSLYTDADELLLDVQRPIVMNGIIDFMTRPDLQDRAIILDLPVIPEENRLPESDYWKRVTPILPKALGFLLETLSWALKCLPTVSLKRLPRMADFARLAEAAYPYLNLPEGGFLELYGDNREAGTLTALEQSPIADALRRLVNNVAQWEGTPTELLVTLEQTADERTKGDKRWPGNARAMGAELKRLAPALRSVGVDVQTSRKKNGRRLSVKLIQKNTPARVTQG